MVGTLKFGASNFFSSQVVGTLKPSITYVSLPLTPSLKNLKKKYQEKWENAYLRVKNARASRALRWALDPGQYWLTSLNQLCFATSAKSREKFLAPALTKSWILLGAQEGAREWGARECKNYTCWLLEGGVTYQILVSFGQLVPVTQPC